MVNDPGQPEKRIRLIVVVGEAAFQNAASRQMNGLIFTVPNHFRIKDLSGSADGNHGGAIQKDTGLIHIPAAEICTGQTAVQGEDGLQLRAAGDGNGLLPAVPFHRAAKGLKEVPDRDIGGAGDGNGKGLQLQQLAVVVDPHSVFVGQLQSGLRFCSGHIRFRSFRSSALRGGRGCGFFRRILHREKRFGELGIAVKQRFKAVLRKHRLLGLGTGSGGKGGAGRTCLRRAQQQRQHAFVFSQTDHILTFG